MKTKETHQNLMRRAASMLSVVMVTMFAMPMEAWAQAGGQVPAGEKLTFIAIPSDELGELAFDEKTKRLSVTPKEGY